MEVIMWITQLLVATFLAWSCRHILDWLLLPKIRQVFVSVSKFKNGLLRRRQIASDVKFLNQFAYEVRQTSDPRHILIRIEKRIATMAIGFLAVASGTICLLQPSYVALGRLAGVFASVCIITGFLIVLRESLGMNYDAWSSATILSEKEELDYETYQRMATKLPGLGMTIDDVQTMLAEFIEARDKAPPSAPTPPASNPPSV